MGITREITKNTNAPVEIKIVIKFKLCNSAERLT